MKCLDEYVKNCKILHLIIIKSITCYLGRLNFIPNIWYILQKHKGKKTTLVAKNYKSW